MKPYIKNLGKISITVDKDYYDSEKEYDRLVIVEKENDGTYISRQPVPANTSITNREYWIPLVTIDGSFDYMIDVTTNELRGLISNKTLIPGMNYRITDYNPNAVGSCVTAIQNLTISNQLKNSAGTQIDTFYIITKALSDSTVSEEALASRKDYGPVHSYSVYWGSTKFENWKINIIVSPTDNRRPSWCKYENAPIWISYMKDEYNNEAPFDFKSYGFSINSGETLNVTENTKELTGITWLTGERWHVFSEYNNNYCVDASLTGFVTNCKLTDWNIVNGEFSKIEINGKGNIIVRYGDERLSNIAVYGNYNRVLGSDAVYGSNNIINGYSNIVVNAAIKMNNNNNSCVIKTSINVIFGCDNSNIRVVSVNNLELGSNNNNWDISNANNIFIGSNNIKNDNSVEPNYIHAGNSDGNVYRVEHVVIGNNNKNIRLYATTKTIIGNNNNGININCTKDGEQCSCAIGSDNTVSISGTEINNFNIGSYNNVTIQKNSSFVNSSLADITIGNNNVLTIEPSTDNNIQAFATIMNYNVTDTVLRLSNTDIHKIFYVNDDEWYSYSFNGNSMGLNPEDFE